jgi:hypothetical protein
MKFSFLIYITASALALIGCGNEDDPVAGLVSDLILVNGVSTNGVSTNGVSTNNTYVNGVSTNTVTINGVSTNGWENGSTSFGTATLSKGELSASSGWGSRKSGTALSGTEVPAQLSDGSSFKMRIDGATYDSKAQLWLYDVSLRADNGAWYPYCGTGENGPVQAIALQGRYDNVTGAYTADRNMFTFACVNGALGKCVMWGYKPWTTREECRGDECETRSLHNWHLACTRMVRADYCGDGVAHTRNGTLINIWDVFAIQSRASSTGWDLEAEWTADGAECIRHTRWTRADPTSALTDLAYIQQNCPSRLAARSTRCDESRSNFHTRYGFWTALDDRRLLRNESASE